MLGDLRRRRIITSTAYIPSVLCVFWDPSPFCARRLAVRKTAPTRNYLELLQDPFGSDDRGLLFGPHDDDVPHQVSIIAAPPGSPPERHGHLPRLHAFLRGIRIASEPGQHPPPAATTPTAGAATHRRHNPPRFALGEARAKPPPKAAAASSTRSSASHGGPHDEWCPSCGRKGARGTQQFPA